MIPSVEKICGVGLITRSQAVSVRHAMYQYMHPELSDERTTLHDAMQRINDIVNGYGVDYIPQGRNKRSPAIDFVNMGDTYNTTVMFVNGRFRIGSWGDIVERGNYD